jgi:hypothetical protein
MRASALSGSRASSRSRDQSRFGNLAFVFGFCARSCDLNIRRALFAGPKPGSPPRLRCWPKGGGVSRQCLLVVPLRDKPANVRVMTGVDGRRAVEAMVKTDVQLLLAQPAVAAERCRLRVHRLAAVSQMLLWVIRKKWIFEIRCSVGGNELTRAFLKYHYVIHRGP